MVFPSLPLYLDPPNWQPRNETQNPDQLSPPPPHGGGGGGGRGGGGGGDGTTSIRPGSMTDRARLAKIPQPEAGLKCPRCESTNTKFCYFNNYNLSQPRHFCKACRRYWTRGGALRNVPVGGGCRRNKRSKIRDRSKSPAPERQLAGSASTTTVPPQSHLPFLPSLHHLSDYGLNLGMIPHPSAAARSGGGGADFEFHAVPNSSTSVTSAITDQWRLQQSQQFPNFLANLEQPTVLYTFDSPDQTAVDATRYSQVGPVTGQLGFSKLQIIENNGISPVAGAVKMEENKGLNLTKNFQFWQGSGPGGSNNINAWAGGAADISGFSSSSTSHLLG